MYSKELATVVMEADESQGLQLASWRPRRADGIGGLHAHDLGKAEVSVQV